MTFIIYGQYENSKVFPCSNILLTANISIYNSYITF